ncbi:MAG: sporulation protein YqfD [Clostridiales bacterium]|nr:sporulation protein YqfD [Clostridiales bacterium]
MWRFLQGYVIIELTGLSLERFLNAMLRAGITPWQVERRGTSCIRLRLRARDFRKLRPIRRKYRCRVHILSRHGPVFALVGLWRRKVLLAGCVLALAAITALSTRILFVRITGCETMDEQVLREMLAEEGIVPFAAWRGLNNLGIATSVAARRPELAWVGITREGVIYTVEVREAIPRMEIPDLSVPCDVIAAKDGMVTRLTVLRGQARVQVGDWVRAGDVLISSRVEYNAESPPYYTHAMGEVWVARLYEARVKAPVFAQEYRRTGALKRYGKLALAGRVLWERQPPYPWFELAVRDVCRWEKLFVPIALTRGAYLECVPVNRPIGRAQQEEEARARAELQAMWQIPKDAAILLKNCYVREEEDGLWAVCIITTEEEIGYAKVLRVES